MRTTAIARRRVLNQWIGRWEPSSPKEAVKQLGAMQAQDFAMSKWAVGIRSSGITEAEVDAALDRGDILRTHLLRPTWHLVAKEDIRWMLDLTAPRIKMAMRSNAAQRGLDEGVFKRSNKVIVKALSSGKHLVRAELQAALERAKLPTDDNRLSHMLMRAELDALCCSGAAQGKQTTHALLEERAPNMERINREEALERLATRYFTGHGPATMKDFIWWSGLTMTDAKRAIAAVRSNFTEVRIEENSFLMPTSDHSASLDHSGIHLLPAFDELIIGYADRTAVLSEAEQRHALSSNGMFYPTVIKDGKAIGLWKRKLGREKVDVEVAPFKKMSRTEFEIVKQQATDLGRFLQKTVEVHP